MRKIIFLAILFLCLAFISSPVLAENRPVENRPTDNKMMDAHDSSKAAMKEEKMGEVRTGNQQERAAKEISRRIDSLKQLLSRIAEFKKISSSQKATLSTQVQDQIDQLTALQAKIAADTDTAVLQTDIKSIIASYRIYALFMPKIQMLGATDRILTVADEMSAQELRLESKLPALQGKGENVTEPQAMLADMKTKIADAKVQAQTAMDTVTPLVPDGFPANKTQLQSARSNILNAVKDLNTARQDARGVIVWLVQITKNDEVTDSPLETSPSPSINP